MSSCGWGACYMGRVEGLKERLHCMVFNCLHHIPQIQLLRTYLLYFKDSESLVKNRTLPYLFFLFFFLKEMEGFPCDSMVKNLLASVGDTYLIPDPGEAMPWSNLARTSQLLSLCSRAHVQQLLKPKCLTQPVLSNQRSH